MLAAYVSFTLAGCTETLITMRTKKGFGTLNKPNLEASKVALLYSSRTPLTLF
jgi:hypothetical protein